MQLTINPLKETELILYGGEFYNGQKVSFRLFWSLLSLFHLLISVWFSKHAIQNCFFFMWMQTYVYGDLYRYDVDKQEWKLVSSPNSPPPRSSHQAVAWKNYLYIFGMFSFFFLSSSFLTVHICKPLSFYRLGGEFTSPNQERFHHYKVRVAYLLIFTHCFISLLLIYYIYIYFFVSHTFNFCSKL